MARGQADLALKEADLLNKRADLSTREAAAEGAATALEDARRRDALIDSFGRAGWARIGLGLRLPIQRNALLRNKCSHQIDPILAHYILNDKLFVLKKLHNQSIE